MLRRQRVVGGYRNVSDGVSIYTIISTLYLHTVTTFKQTSELHLLGPEQKDQTGIVNFTIFR